MKYTTKKIMNNNVVLVKSLYGKELILIGDGIGFHSKAGKPFTQIPKVKQVFELRETKNKNDFRAILESVDPRLVALVEEELSKIQQEFEEPLNENIHITLIDHIAFAMERHKKGLDFHNPFDSGLKTLYPKEYKMAEALIKRIRQSFKEELIDDEAGIIAIHIHAAAKNEMVEKTRTKAVLIQELVGKIYEAFHLDMNTDSLAHQRMMVHVSFAVERIWSGQTIENNLTEYIMENYREYFEKIKEVAEQVSKDYEEMEIQDSEISYLTIHFIRIMEELQENQK